MKEPRSQSTQVWFWTAPGVAVSYPLTQYPGIPQAHLEEEAKEGRPYGGPGYNTAQCCRGPWAPAACWRSLLSLGNPLCPQSPEQP